MKQNSRFFIFSSHLTSFLYLLPKCDIQSCDWSLGFVLFKSVSMTLCYVIVLFTFRSVRRRMEKLHVSIIIDKSRE